MANRGGIGRNLLLSYFILLFSIIMITGLSFNLLSHRYLINETRQQMIEEGKIIAKRLNNQSSLKAENIKGGLVTRRELRLMTTNLETKVIILNNEKRVVYTNIETNELKRYQKIINGVNGDRDYVTARVPIKNNRGNVEGNLLLIAKTKDIKALNGLVRRAQILSLLLAAVIAIIMSFIFEKKLTKPLEKLTEYIRNFNINKSKPVKLKTGDELQELAEGFNELAENLKAYDEKQMRFLQNSSHELKTPLMSIQGYAEAIKDGVVEGEEVVKSLDIIIEESKRLKKTVDEVIHLTRLENPDDLFNRKPVDFGDLIHQTVEKVKPLAIEKNININIYGEYPTISVDGDEMLRAVMNILGNALRFAKSKIHVEGVIQEEDFRLIIEDDGPGFKEGEEKIVFERFYKGDQSGTGIGLAMVKAIVEGHGGIVKAKNILPHGACFIIQLPIKKNIFYPQR